MVFSAVLSVVVVRTVLVARSGEDAVDEVADVVVVELRTSLDVGSERDDVADEDVVDAGAGADVVVVELRTSLGTSLGTGSEEDDTPEVDGSDTRVVVVVCALLGSAFAVEEVSDGASVVVRVSSGCAAMYSPRLDSASSTRAQASLAAASSSAVPVLLARASAAK